MKPADHSRWQWSKSYVTLIVICLFLLCIKPYVVSVMSDIVSWFQSCSEFWLAVLITAFCLALTANRIVKIIKGEQHVGQSTMAVSLFVILFYSYFRFIDHSFEFRGIGWYKWLDILYLPFAMLVVQMVVCGWKKKAEAVGVSRQMADAPIDKPEDDRFGYDERAQLLLEELSLVDVSKKSFSVGILGAWGQGKSSFMNLFKQHAKEKGSIVVEFFPRSSKSVSNIQLDFFNAFRSELKKYHTGVYRYISNYAREVAESDDGWLGKLILTIRSAFSTDNEMSRINSVIASIGRKIFVVIEDLDRLTGEEIFEVLKLLERNGTFCNTVFLTAYDKAYVDEVIGKYLDYSVRQQYTDKYFDYEYTLPLIDLKELDRFVEAYLSRMSESQPGDRKDLERYQEAWKENGRFIVEKLVTMRHVKRYLNVFMSRYSLAGEDVNPGDFLVLTLLRYKDLAAYYAVFSRLFLQRGSEEENSSPQLLYLKDDYAETLKELNISEVSKDIIEHLFHTADAGSGESLEGLAGKLEWADSFYNYFFDHPTA